MNRLGRSLLFVPGSRADRFDKALAAGADAVVLDLEDAVGPQDKDAARSAVRKWLDARHRAERPDAPATAGEPAPLPAGHRVDPPALILRINGVDTDWFADDLGLASHAALSAVMLPKTERESTLVQLGSAGARSMVPLIESAAGYARLREICAVPGVQRLAFGTIDFQVDLGMRDAHEDELVFHRSGLVLESRLAGIAPPIDGVSTAIDDDARLAEDVRRARRLGFGAKLCIHPRQVARVNELFAPSFEECAWARRVIDACAAAGGAAVAVDGKMVDKPVLLRAQAILREAGAS